MDSTREADRGAERIEITFSAANLAAGSADEIVLPAHASLLLTAGTDLVNGAEVTFEDRNGNECGPESDSATTTLGTSEISQDPEGVGFWRNRDELWEDELEDALAPTGGMPEILRRQLLAISFNLDDADVAAGVLPAPGECAARAPATAGGPLAPRRQATG